MSYLESHDHLMFSVNADVKLCIACGVTLFVV